MHELSIVENIVRTADGFAGEHGIDKVMCLTVEVGALTGVIPKYLAMYYSDLSEGTALQGSEMKIEEIAAEAFCKNCGEVFDPTQSGQCCPGCGEAEYDILHGYELTVKDMGYI